MIIDHICFAVKNIEEGIAFWCNVFDYRQQTKPVVNTRQKVKVVFLQKAHSLPIKIIEPTKDNKNLMSFVDHGNIRFHHLCFKCDNIHTGINNLKDKGLRLLVPPQPGEAFNNNLIAFMLAGNSLNLEIIDTDSRAEIIP